MSNENFDFTGVSHYNGLQQTDIDVIYGFLYKHLSINKFIPSLYILERVNPSVIKQIFDKKYKNIKEINELSVIKYFLEKKTSKKDYLFDDFSSGLFSIEIDGNFPILMKICFDSKTYINDSDLNLSQVKLVFCSYSISELEEFLVNGKDSIVKKYMYENDYSKQIYFGIITVGMGGALEIKEIPFECDYVDNLNIELNYGKSFIPHYENIIKKLESKKGGIYIFHGNVGTGKTSLLKHLAKKFGGKRMFIFLSYSQIELLGSPSFIPVLMENGKDAVLVIEDAEEVLASREQMSGNGSIISNLLNIGDGILGNILNVSIILTFNTKKENIDKALLRKGRLLYEYDFKKLSIEDSNILFKNLKVDKKAEEPMSLADIYNYTDDNNEKQEEQRKMGFIP